MCSLKKRVRTWPTWSASIRTSGDIRSSGRRSRKPLIARTANSTLLDVGAASGDSALVIRELYPGATVTSLDNNWTNLERAPDPKLVADAFELPFGNESFDYVLCSLFLHHFDDAKVVRLLSEFYGLAKRGLAVCDLERNILPYLFLPATRALLGWNKITVSDGVKSVRASFRASELRSLAMAAGLKNAEVRVYRPAFRLSMIAMK